MAENFDIQKIENTLQQEFNSVDVKDYGNGTYCFTIDNMTRVYATESSLMASTNNAFSYIPGGGQTDTDAALIINAASGGNLGSGLYTVGYSCNDSGNSMDVVMRFSECLGQEVSQLNVYGFSAGAEATLAHSNDILNNYPDLDLNAYLIDPFCIERSNLEAMDISNLVNNGIPIYVVGPNQNGVNYNRESCGPNIRAVVERLVSENNLNVEFLEEPNKANGHIEINKEAIMSLILSGDPDFSRYTCLIYNEETGTFEIGLTSSSVGLGDDFSIIMSMDDIKSLKDSPNDCSTVLSDISLVMENVNGISTTMNINDGLFNPKTQTLSSSATIVNGMVSAQNAFLSISNDLHHRVRDELTLITRIAQNYYDMDGDLSSLASSLKGANSINFTPEHAYTQLNELINLQFDTNVTFFKNFQVPMVNNVNQIGSITMSDIDNLLSPNGSLMSNLQSELDCANNTKREIDSFSSEIGVNLKGDVWNAVKGNLDVLSDLQQTRITSCEKLKSACEKALKMIKDYVSPDTELDTANIPILEAEIARLTSELEAKQTITIHNDETGEDEYYEEYVLQGAERTNAENARIEAQAALEKLNGLKAVVDEATNIINDALQQIYNNYGVQVSNFVSGRVDSYKPSFGGRITNFNYLDYRYTIENLLGLPYINQADYPGGMVTSGCGWASLAMVVSGLSGEYIDAIEMYERQTGKKYTGGKINPAQREDLGVSSDAGNPSSLQMSIFEENGIIPEKISIRGASDAADRVALKVAGGAAVIICTDTHYSVVAPGENGKYVYMSSNYPGKNGVYDSVEEIFAVGNISPGNINYGVSYTAPDGPNQVSIPTHQYSPTIKNYVQPESLTPGNSSDGGNYNNSIPFPGVSNQAPSTIGTPEDSLPKDEIVVEPPVEDVPVEDVPSIDKPIEDLPVKDENINIPSKKEDEIINPEPDYTIEVRPSTPTKPSVSTKPNISTKPTYNIPNSYVPNDTIGTIQKPTEIPGISDIIEIPDSYIPEIEEPPRDILDNQIDSGIPKPDNIKELPLDGAGSRDTNETAKAIATLAGVGAAVGAAAYGAHKYIKSREDEEEKSYDEEEDY